MYQQISISSIFLGLLIYSIYAEEILIQIVVKKPINIVSDRYVSFSIDPSHLLELSLRPSNFENSTILAKSLGAAYFKIAGGTTNQFTLDDETIPSTKNQIRITPSDWQALHQWISETNLKPIVTLPYSSKQWSLRNIISILGISKRLGIRNCIWQLGSELNTTETIDYVDDLSAFKTIIDVFRKNGSNWGVVGADITTGCKADEADLYAELSKHISEANGWTQPMEYTSLEHEDNIFFEKYPGLRGLLKSKVPVWLNIQQSPQRIQSELCGSECELQGLRWADTLGASAQIGFKVVFQKIDKFDVMNPSFSYYVSLLHKKIMGEKVFDTKILNGDNLSPKYFTHCTKNMSGSFSVMGVNFADYKTKISTKLPIKYTGSEVYQYVLNVDRGYVLLNGVPVNIHSDIQPIVMVKKQNRPTTFTLPPRSIGFWVFPLANLKQCSTKSDVEPVSPTKDKITYDLDMSSRTASEKLLHELISEILQIDSSRNEVKRPKRHAIVKKDSKHMNRMKRNADPGYKTRRDLTLYKKFNDETFSNQILGRIILPKRRVRRQLMNNIDNQNNRFRKLFKTFELPQVKKFNMAKFWNLPPPTQNTIIQNKVAIPPVISTIQDVRRLDPSEQIFRSVENSDLPQGEVLFHVGEERNMDYVQFDERSEKHRQQKKNHVDKEKFVDFDIEDVQDMPDQMYEFYHNARGKPQPIPEMSPYSELWESDVFQKAPPPDAGVQRNQFHEDTNNYEQNIDMIVKELPPTFRQNQENLMKARNTLSTIYVGDGDRMSSSHIKLPIRHVDMDDDDFFVSKRKKRSIDSNFNEEIENKVNNLKKSRNDDDEMGENAKNGIKINLLEKITKLIDSLEKIDDIEKFGNIEKLNADIKDLENFLFRRSSKFNVFKPKNRISQKDIRRKCKILSINLEQQCLKENDFYPSRLIKRDAKYTSDHKANKISALKNAFPKEKSDKLNRIRRNTAWESPSWEDNYRNNMIIKEYYTTNEDNYNKYVPSISLGQPISLNPQYNEDKSFYTEQVSVLQNLPDRHPKNSISQTSFESTITEQSNEPQKVYSEQISVVESFPNSYIKYFKQNVPETSPVIEEIAEERVVPTISVDRNLGHLIENHHDENQEVKEYQTPKFMKKISKTVENWMDVVEKHVSGWWHIMS